MKTLFSLLFSLTFIFAIAQNTVQDNTLASSNLHLVGDGENDFDVKDDDDDKPKHKRRLYVGGGIGIGVSSTQFDQTGFAFRINSLDAGFLIKDWIGVHINTGAEGHAYDDNLSGNDIRVISNSHIFVGPMFSIQIGRILDIDFKPKVGLTVVNDDRFNNQSEIDFSAGSSVSFRFNVGRHIAILVTPESYYTFDQETHAILTSVGVAYRIL